MGKWEFATNVIMVILMFVCIYFGTIVIGELVGGNIK